MLKNVYEGLNARCQVYLSKEHFCEMYPTCVSSKHCEFIWSLSPQTPAPDRFVHDISSVHTIQYRITFQIANFQMVCAQLQNLHRTPQEFWFWDHSLKVKLAWLHSCGGGEKSGWFQLHICGRGCNSLIRSSVTTSVRRCACNTEKVVEFDFSHILVQ